MASVQVLSIRPTFQLKTHFCIQILQNEQLADNKVIHRDFGTKTDNSTNCIIIWNRHNGWCTRHAAVVTTLQTEVLCVVLVTADVATLSSSSSDDRMWTTSAQSTTAINHAHQTASVLLYVRRQIRSNCKCNGLIWACWSWTAPNAKTVNDIACMVSGLVGCLGKWLVRLAATIVALIRSSDLHLSRPMLMTMVIIRFIITLAWHL